MGASLAAACFASRPSKGGGQISERDKIEARQRRANPYDIDVPAGYRIELVAEKLNFPTGVALGDRGEIYVSESGYSYGEKLAVPRVVAIRDGKPLELIAGKDGAPWNGLAVHDGALYVAHGGALDGGKIVRHALVNGAPGPAEILVDGLPSLGDHHTNGPVISRDGWLYFGQGTATNSAVVGPDNHDFGWLSRKPDFHDVPCQDVVLTGVNFTAKNPLTPADDEVTTGAYLPFGTPSTPGQIIRGRVPCNGAILRVRLSEGGAATPTRAAPAALVQAPARRPVELVAWGFRNPFGLALGSDGTSLLVTDNGLDTRGSRPVFGAADPLWRVEPGKTARWHGWPDFAEGRPLTASWYGEDAGDPKGFVLAKHPGTPPEPAAYLPVHAAATGLDVSRSAEFGHVGQAFVTLFGDMAPVAGKVLHPVGFAVMKVDPQSGELEYFARNRPDRPGPASAHGSGGLERPIAARFDRDGKALYIVDFGIIRMSPEGPKPVEHSGKLWRITREVSHAR